VSGSIAAFKAAALASEMVKAAMEVRVVLTPGGARFVTPLTFEGITGNRATIDVWDEQPGASRMGHLELARWADVLVVAPASADIIARLSLGLAGDMLTSVAIASRAPLVIAPAMETEMWLHPATQQHLATLTERGANVVGPVRGRLASGTEGEGRMAEPTAILEQVWQVLRRSADLAGLRVVVTAGPTVEAIDPVRFIGNRSSGKMGFAIAEEARDRGASVLLITGPTAIPDPTNIDVIQVESAADMREALVDAVTLPGAGAAAASRDTDRAPGDPLKQPDVIIMAAAIADFRPASRSAQKIRREKALSLELVPTPDLAEEVAQLGAAAFHVGFALESADLVEGARRKLRQKGQQLVVANLVSDEHNPFGSDTNRVTFVSAADALELPQMSKREVARRLWDEILRLRAKNPG
jgi:phosphopantothenoylcysteine decarboxylase / phosphopantothenate---cysteine ligase